VKEVKRWLEAAGLGEDAVLAKTFECNLAQVEQIDRLIANAEARRNAALREIGRHRQAVKAAIEMAIGEAEDAEFSEVQAPPMASEVE
jgi:hypothetical protein